MSDPLALALGVAVGLVGAPFLGALAARFGFTDPPPGAPVPERKRGQLPRPVAGGVVVVLAFASTAGSGTCVAEGAWGGLVASLTLAFALGALDDRLPRGLPPLAKLGGQLVAAAPLGVALGLALGDGGALAIALGVLGVVASVNVVNTWDHSDGLVAVGFGPALVFGAPAVGGALLGFLPHNAFLRVDESRGRPLLGDGGSHALGVLVAAIPAVWPLLLLPALDLARVLVLRAVARQAPWVGDRRHLGHLLERLGTRVGTRLTVVAVLSLPGAASSIANLVVESLSQSAS